MAPSWDGKSSQDRPRQAKTGQDRPRQGKRREGKGKEEEGKGLEGKGVEKCGYFIIYSKKEEKVRDEKDVYTLVERGEG